MNFAYTITSSKSFNDATRAIEQAVAVNGFRVLHTHDVQQTFAEKGVAREPYKIVEVCNVKYASQALNADPLIGLMMPCKIVVFAEPGATKISLLLPSLLSEFFPHANLGAMAREVETILRAVVDSAK
ncbi:MAG: DUF302 domain-containing protein [Chloroflexi bacterium]|nr:DUF302 domain-containing protein [Chloroflexota bacterium]